MVTHIMYFDIILWVENWLVIRYKLASTDLLNTLKPVENSFDFQELETTSTTHKCTTVVYNKSLYIRNNELENWYMTLKWKFGAGWSRSNMGQFDWFFKTLNLIFRSKGKGSESAQVRWQEERKGWNLKSCSSII